jgi:hypothetical protein
MTAIEVLTKADMEQFKAELFAELRRLGIHPAKRQEQREWLKSYEVRKLLGISPGTLQNLRTNGTLPYTKIGGLLFYRQDDIRKLMEGNYR